LIAHAKEAVRVMVIVPLVQRESLAPIASHFSDKRRRKNKDLEPSVATEAKTKTALDGNGFGLAAATRSRQARLDEAHGLARAINLDIVASAVLTIDTPRPATFLTSGKVDIIGAQIAQDNVDLVIVDHALTPVQQRNLERIWRVKVIDRTGLILEIFGARARTKEGGLQVELAHLHYQKSRLVRSWTHLERQRGGTGFLGGPGETQIEADRRILQSKINKIQREIEKVVKTRSLHRIKRQKIPYPVLALVGYTNAGKSTLFNALTGAGVEAQDMLFATLDPTLRRLKLPSGTPIILSDTVGFISNLPHHLIAAFRATLEEVVEAHLILHVRDIHDPDSQAQAHDVMSILDRLGVKAMENKRIIEVWNKADLLEEGQRNQILKLARHSDVPTYLVSAAKKEGINELLDAIEQRLVERWKRYHIRLGSHEMALMAWLYRHARTGEKENMHRRDLDNGEVELECMLSDEDWGRFMTLRANATKV